MRVNWAVVSTMADSHEHLEDWLFYHRQLGATRFYLFFDDASEESVEVASRYSDIFYVTASALLQRVWSLLPDFQSQVQRLLLREEVMTRQEFNARVAILLARQEGQDWLLHIDSDELLYPNGCDLNKYFSELMSNRFGSVVFLNYEVAPTSIECESPFRELTLFKKNFFRRRHWVFSREQRNFIASQSWLPSKYFNYYQNGKCAANVNDGLRVEGVHEIRAEHLNLKLGGEKDPIILHYPCARYLDFKTKYERLGVFSNFWKGVSRTGRYIDDFHLQARDLLMRSEKEFKQFYETRVMVNRTQADELISQALAEIVEFPSEMLKCSAVVGRAGASKNTINSSRNVLKNDAYKSDILSVSGISEKSKRDEIVVVDLAWLLTEAGVEQCSFNSRSEALLWLRSAKPRQGVACEILNEPSGRYIFCNKLWFLEDVDFDLIQKVLSKYFTISAQSILFSNISVLVSRDISLVASKFIAKRMSWLAGLLNTIFPSSRLLCQDSIPFEYLAPSALSGRVSAIVDWPLVDVLSEASKDENISALSEYLMSNYVRYKSGAMVGFPRMLVVEEIVRSVGEKDLGYIEGFFRVLSFFYVKWIVGSDESNGKLEAALKNIVLERDQFLGFSEKNSIRLLWPENVNIMTVLVSDCERLYVMFQNMSSRPIGLDLNFLERYGLIIDWESVSGQSFDFTAGVSLPPYGYILLSSSR